MNLFVGYQLCQSDTFLNRILANKEEIGEVYLSWGAAPSGRCVTGLQKDMLPYGRQTERILRLRSE